MPPKELMEKMVSREKMADDGQEKMADDGQEKTMETVWSNASVVTQSASTG